jgi:type II secretion system protein I
MSNPKNGFTLIEVLVALVVISLAFSGFIMSLSSTAQNYRRLNDKVIATIVGTNLMARFRAGLIKFEQGKGFSEQTKMADKIWKSHAVLNKTKDKEILEIIIVVNDSNNQEVFNIKGFASVYSHK